MPLRLAMIAAAPLVLLWSAAAPAQPGYRLGDWSPWAPIKDSGARFRYRWGFNPASPKSVDAIFEVANRPDKPFKGNVRAITCTGNQLSNNQGIAVGPGATGSARFRTDNCGDAAQPFFKGAATMSYSY